MSHRKFALLLSATIGSMLVFTFYVHNRYDVLKAYTDMSLWGIIAFSLVCLLFYFLSDYLSRKSMDKAYMNLVFINFFVKLCLVLMLPIAYYKIKNPESGHFVLPFLVIYVVFTVFETYFLNKKASMRR